MQLFFTELPETDGKELISIQELIVSTSPSLFSREAMEESSEVSFQSHGLRQLNISTIHTLIFSPLIEEKSTQSNQLPDNMLHTVTQLTVQLSVVDMVVTTISGMLNHSMVLEELTLGLDTLTLFLLD